MTVVGHAGPGLVHRVLAAVEDIDDVVELRNVSMAILEGTSVLTVVFLRKKPSSLSDLQRLISKGVAHALSGDKESAPLAVQVARAAHSGSAKNDWPTHELNIVAAEQPGIVAKVARVLANHDANITWFVSYLLEPIVGDKWPMCAIQMHLHIEENRREEVGARLRTLKDAEGWRSMSLSRWSLTGGLWGQGAREA